MLNFSKNKYYLFTVVCAGILFAFLLYHFRMWFLDDTFISMRYARNWAGSNGLVFNPGERVEGYTNFLWVAFMAIGFKLNMNVPLMARATGIILTILLFIQMALYVVKNLSFSPRLFFLLIMVFVSQGDFAVWANSGMETMLYTVLLTGSVLLVAKSESNNRWNMIFAGTGLLLAALTRPEGVLGVAVSVCFVLVRDKESYHFDKRNLLKVFFVIIPFIIVYIPYFIWRYNYFGWIFPNTFYAKVGFSAHTLMRGLKYSALFFFDHWFIVLGSLGVIFSNRGKNPVIHYFLAMVLVYISYIVYVGGDVFPAYRFFMPVLPLLYLCFSEGIYSFRVYPRSIIRKSAVFLLIFCLVFQLLQLGYRQDYHSIRKDRVSEVGKKVGVWLRKNVPASTVIAVNPIGAMPYYSRLYTIDMLGLTDEYIAHHANRVASAWAGHEIGDGEYVLSRKPDIVVLDGPWGDITPLFKGDYELTRSRQFQTEYEFMNIPIDDIIFQCFVRKESRLVMKIMNHFRYYK